MLADVPLGPSLFGFFWPEAQIWLFPWDPTQQTPRYQKLPFLAPQLGLVLYMFVIGMEFRVDIVQRTLQSAVAVSIAGIAVHLLFGRHAGLGVLQIHRLISNEDLADGSDASRGRQCTTTALPVLARDHPIQEREATL